MHSWPPRVLVLGAVLVLASAGVVAFAVVPPVRTDTFSLAAPGRAVPAFWGLVLLDVLVAVMALTSSRVGSTRATLRRALSGVSGGLALLLGLLLIDAAIAFSGHGPAMRGAVAALWVSVCLDLAGGVAMVSSALARS